MSVRVAAIDCGTNSLRLLIADVDVDAGRLIDVERRTRIVRLGEGGDASGEISAAAVDRAPAVTADYARACARAGVGAVRFVATSASRDARNAAVFVDGVRAVLGVDPEVRAGDQEARLSFAGATRELTGPGSGRAPRPVLVVDVGGGSTEFVLGDGDGTPVAAASVDVGSVRMTERHLRAGDPPTAAAVAAARQEVDHALDAVARIVDLRGARTLVGLAGTVTTVTAHALGLPGYESALVHGAVLPPAQVLSACADLIAAPRRRLDLLPYLDPDRVDVIAGGALVWGAIVERVTEVAGPVDVVTSEHDLLDGVAWSLARTSPAPLSPPEPVQGEVPRA